MLINPIEHMLKWPKKFKRHCWNLFRFVFFCSVAQMLIEEAKQRDLVEHFALIEVCFYIILISGIAWFAWRAYVGLERDLDFYDDF